MFGIKRRIWTKQLKRAATIENCVKMGIFEHLVKSHGYNAVNKPSDAEGALFAGTAHYIVAWDIQAQLQMLKGHPQGAETIRSMAAHILARDPDLERLVIRLLYEIASLTRMLGREDWAQEYLHDHPRIMDIVTAARTTHPDLFHDVRETEFKALFGRFIDKYLSDMQGTARAIFD